MISLRHYPELEFQFQGRFHKGASLKLEFLLWSNLTPLPVKEGPGDKAGRECPQGHQAHQRLLLPAAQPHLVRHLDLGARYDTHVIAKQQASYNIKLRERVWHNRRSILFRVTSKGGKRH